MIGHLCQRYERARVRDASQYDWKLLFTVRRCHKWYLDQKSGRVAPCDYSGKYPHETDDGVLWLDTDSHIEVVSTYECEDIRIPLLTTDGERRWLGGTTGEEVSVVRDRLGMPVERY